MSKTSKFLPLLLGIVAAIGMIFGMRLQKSLEYDGIVSRVDKAPEQSIVEALQHIRSKYYGDILYEDFTNAVLADMIEELDPYSHYFPKARDEDYNRYVNGLYEGIGIEYMSYNDSLFVSTIIPNGPASQTDISRGDVLLMIDSIDIQQQSIDIDSIGRLSRRNVGDQISLTVWHRLSNEIESYSLSVTSVSLPLVKSFLVEEHSDIAYIQIKRFYKGVFRDFMDELDGYHMDSIKVEHLIIDLRGNLGGVVDETIKLLNQFFTEKEVVLLSTEDNAQQVQDYNSNGRTFVDLGRVVVLIDERSASASEIMAAVLQDHDRAVIMGTNSYGKGVIQQNYNLSNDGSINLTIGAYRLPSGRYISQKSNSDSTYFSLKNQRKLPQGRGVTPDVLFSMCEDDKTHANQIQRTYIAEQLWNMDALYKYLGEAANEKGGGAIDSCEYQRNLEATWGMLDFSMHSRSMINSKYMDAQVKKAYELLLSDSYDAILKGL
ncbi:MAG: carboxyl-terminal processing protease [Saprospiraceae bacterium]|jgi:carboxyl-terminal processing protease